MHRRTLLTGLAATALTPVLLGASEPDVVPFDVGEARIRVVFEPGELGPGREAVVLWIRRCCEAVAAWYGRFPTHPTVIRVVPYAGRGVHGRTWGGSDPRIRLQVGSQTPLEALYADWVLVHELVHLAFPNVPSDHHWVEEGLSTYVEPWIRVACEQITPEKAWLDLVEGLPKGQPFAGDKGLDHTPTWGRTYWGGALWCLVTDVALRERTDGRTGLKEALVGILDAGGSMHVSWSMAKAMATGDGVTGHTALTDSWKRLADQPVTIDLDAMWSRLGVVPDGRTVRLDDRAPLASIRRAIEGTSGH